MRRAAVMGVTALAVAVALATALAQTPGRSSARARGSGSSHSVVAPALPGMPSHAPELEEEDGDGMERMDGPDAWERMGMGPAGLRVPGSGRLSAAARVRMMQRRAEVARQLELTDAQRDRIEAIRDRQRRAAIEQQARLQLARLDLRSMLRAEKVDRAAIGAKVDEVARLEAQLARSRIESLLDVRGVLTDEQRKKLRALRSQWGDGDI